MPSAQTFLRCRCEPASAIDRECDGRDGTAARGDQAEFDKPFDGFYELRLCQTRDAVKRLGGAMRNQSAVFAGVVEHPMQDQQFESSHVNATSLTLASGPHRLSRLVGPCRHSSPGFDGGEEQFDLVGDPILSDSASLPPTQVDGGDALRAHLLPP